MQASPGPCTHSPEQCSPNYPAGRCPAAASGQMDMTHRSLAPRTPVAGVPPHLTECCRQRPLCLGCDGAQHWQRCCVPAGTAEMHIFLILGACNPCVKAIGKAKEEWPAGQASPLRSRSLLKRPDVQGSPILMQWTDCMQSAAALSSSGSSWGLCTACACASGAMCQRHQQAPLFRLHPGLWALPSPAAHKFKACRQVDAD